MKHNSAKEPHIKCSNERYSGKPSGPENTTKPPPINPLINTKIKPVSESLEINFALILHSSFIL